MIPWLRASRRAVSVTYAFNDMYSSTNSVSPDNFFLVQWWISPISLVVYLYSICIRPRM